MKCLRSRELHGDIASTYTHPNNIFFPSALVQLLSIHIYELTNPIVLFSSMYTGAESVGDEHTNSLLYSLLFISTVTYDRTKNCDI